MLSLLCNNWLENEIGSMDCDKTSCPAEIQTQVGPPTIYYVRPIFTVANEYLHNENCSSNPFYR